VTGCLEVTNIVSSPLLKDNNGFQMMALLRHTMPMRTTLVERRSYCPFKRTAVVQRPSTQALLKWKMRRITP